ncbi:MAG TPA: TetR/AcrR family transcriptional regulator [Beutenbergiaceae bacterium]|nr:TetR/AcrR family transcriptional regulator [Beutenbergiaceae bacterium]
MPRQADPARRVEVIDAAIRHAADVGFAHLTLRGVADAMAQSTRVVTHHFSDKLDLISAMLDRFHDREKHSLRSDAAWSDPEIPVSRIVEAAWNRTLSPSELPYTKLIHEIEGLAAAGHTPTPIPGFLADRAAFVAECLQARGTPREEAIALATMLNAAYTGLQIDHLTTGDHARTKAGLAQLCSWIDRAVATVTP